MKKISKLLLALGLLSINSFALIDHKAIETSEETSVRGYVVSEDNYTDLSKKFRIEKVLSNKNERDKVKVVVDYLYGEYNEEKVLDDVKKDMEEKEYYILNPNTKKGRIIAYNAKKNIAAITYIYNPFENSTEYTTVVTVYESNGLEDNMYVDLVNEANGLLKVTTSNLNKVVIKY